MRSPAAVVSQKLDSLFTVPVINLPTLNMSDLAQLHKTISAHQVLEVARLIESGADVNAVFQRETAFTQAIAIGCSEAVDVIIASKNCDPNAKNQFNASPLYLSVKANRVDYVSTLLKMGAQVDNADVRGNTPLIACAWTDNARIAGLLIQHGANINLPDVKGCTPLQHACTNVARNVVLELLQHNCDVNHQCDSKRTALMLALPSFYNSSVAGKKITDMLSICEMLIDFGCDLNIQDDRGKTALHQRVEADDVYGLCMLAERGCNLSIKDNSRHTPFHTAILCSEPKFDIARFLLYYGADAMEEVPESCSSSASPPLSVVLNCCLSQQEPEIGWSRDMLLRCMQRCVYPAQAVTNKCEFDLYTANRNKTKKQDVVVVEVIEWLQGNQPCSLQHQAVLAVRRTLGSTNIIPKINLLPVGPNLREKLTLGLHPDWIPLYRLVSLHVDIQDHHNDSLQGIVLAGLNINLPINGKTPIAVALEVGNMEAAQLLLNTPKSCPVMVNSSGDSALHVAAKHGRDELINKIVNVHADINMRNFREQTPLYVAIQAGRFTTAAILITMGADLSGTDSNSVSLLHMAAASGSSDVIELLLARGMDPNLEDSFQNTPLHVAASKGGLYVQEHIAVPGLYDDAVAESLDSINMVLNAALPKLMKKVTGHAQVVRCLISYGGSLTKMNANLQTPLNCAEWFRSVDLIAELDKS
ncbi:hypothetical protein BsWGS_28431 [Bradybaena similaris]